MLSRHLPSPSTHFPKGDPARVHYPKYSWSRVMNQRATFQFLILSEFVTVGRFPQECDGLERLAMEDHYLSGNSSVSRLEPELSKETCQTWNEGDSHRFRKKENECEMLCGSWYPPGLLGSATWMSLMLTLCLYSLREQKLQVTERRVYYIAYKTISKSKVKSVLTVFT